MLRRDWGVVGLQEGHKVGATLIELGGHRFVRRLSDAGDRAFAVMQVRPIFRVGIMSSTSGGIRDGNSRNGAKQGMEDTSN